MHVKLDVNGSYQALLEDGRIVDVQPLELIVKLNGVHLKGVFILELDTVAGWVHAVALNSGMEDRFRGRVEVFLPQRITELYALSASAPEVPFPWCRSCRSYHHPDNPTCHLKQLGKRTIGTGVGAIIEHEGRLLTIRRGPDCPYDVGLWEFPGGKVDLGESLRVAAARETKEEVGLDVECVDYLGYSELITETLHWIGHTFYCRVRYDGEEPPLPEIGDSRKVEIARWVTPREVDVMYDRGELSIWTKKDWDRCRHRFLDRRHA